MPERAVNIQVQVGAKTILDTPEAVMQQLSLRVFQRRDKLISELLGKRVSYELNGKVCSGTLERIDGSTAYVLEDGERTRVSVKRLRL